MHNYAFDGEFKGDAFWVDSDNFLKDYSKSRFGFEKVEMWPDCSMDKSDGYQLHVLKSMLLSALGSMTSDSPSPNLILMASPSRVYTNANYKKHNIVMIPITTKIDTL